MREFVNAILAIMSGMHTLSVQQVSSGGGTDSALDEWINDYNKAIKNLVFTTSGRQTSTRKFLFKLSKNMERLSVICDKRARKLRFLIDEQELEGFVLGEIERDANVLESIANYLEREAEQF
jgi:hypothetical protein